MSTVEELVKKISTLSPATGDKRSAVSLWDDRVYLALSPKPKEHPELFFRGSRESFDRIAWGRTLRWDQFLITETNESLPALVVHTAATEKGRRIMAHVAYEVERCLDRHPKITNAELLQSVEPYLRLAIEEPILSKTHQIGLLGELQFLSEVLQESDTPTERSEVLTSWTGPVDSALRDFHANGVSVEVKASFSGHEHHVSLEQLLIREDDQHLFLCSVRVRPDASGPVKLPEKVKQLEALLEDQELISQFAEKLKIYGPTGYHPEDASLYKIEPGFFVDRTKLRKIDTDSKVLRYTSFKNDKPPSNVSNIQYVLNVQEMPPANKHLRSFVLDTLAGRPT